MISNMQGKVERMTYPNTRNIKLHDAGAVIKGGLRIANLRKLGSIPFRQEMAARVGSSVWAEENMVFDALSLFFCWLRRQEQVLSLLPKLDGSILCRFLLDVVLQSAT
jgi:hypothetical protein